MTEFTTSAAPAKNGMRFKHLLLLAIIAFAGGIGASWWLADSYGWIGRSVPTANTAPQPVKADASDVPPPQVAMPLIPSTVDPAVAASNMARAEGLLVAMAARRAIDNGTPLGYLTDQLRLRFGSSQPRAVITILQASQAPVTLQALQTELTGIENLLMTGSPEETLWATVQREMSELFVLRKSDSPSSAPTQRMLRTHALVESGNIGGAIAEVSAMPGASAKAAQNWLGRARVYDSTHKALDLLERSALAAPPALAMPVAPIAPLPESAEPQIIISE